MREEERVVGTSCRTAPWLRLAAVAGLAVFSTAGCSFWGFGGSGPVEKETAYRLHGRAPWKVADNSAYKRILESSFQAVSWGAVSRESAGVATSQATFRQSSRRYWGSIFLLGWAPGESRILLDKGGDKTERLVGQSGTFIPALWVHLWDNWYSLDKGEELATRCYYGAGPGGVLAGYTRCVQPADISKNSGSLCVTGSETFGQYLAAVTVAKGDEARYNSQWAWHILGGLIGWGRVNYEYFAQVAWLPIRLWRVRE